MENQSSDNYYRQIQNNHEILKKLSHMWSILPTFQHNNCNQYIIKFYLCDKIHQDFKKTKQKPIAILMKYLIKDINGLKSCINTYSQQEKYDIINQSIYMSVQKCDDMFEGGEVNTNLILKYLLLYLKTLFVKSM